MRLNSSASAPSSSLLERRFAGRGAGADPRGRGLDRLDRPHEPRRAGRRSRSPAEEGDEQERGAPDRGLERSEGLAKRLLDEDMPAERSIVWNALSTFVPSSSRPIVAACRASLRPRSAARTCGSEAKLVCRRTRSMFGWVTSTPRESTAYAYPAVPMRARSTTCRMKLRSISATTTPRPGARSATDPHVRLRARSRSGRGPK